MIADLRMRELNAREYALHNRRSDGKVGTDQIRHEKRETIIFAVEFNE